MFRLQWTRRAYRFSRKRNSYIDVTTTQKSHITTTSPFFRVSEEIQQAIAEHRPVVALESTIYTHGFPYPDNLSLASRLESLVRVNGGMPATIGILDGVARVGMGADELIRLVSSAGQPGTRKVSRRDLGFVRAATDVGGKRLHGGTTVSATMILACRAGIKVFATGGLGGVHRDVEQTMDISADLTELGRTPVAVVSSGCKSFLDIPKTLEYLETQGVAVATFADGRQGPVDFPAFWSRDSGIKSPAVVQDEAEAAKVIYAHLSLGLRSGLHFANPIPERYSRPYLEMESAIQQALKEARAVGATGSASTPFILAKIKELTGSDSVEANKSLVEANVVRGTKVAVELGKLEMDETRTAEYVMIAPLLGYRAHGADSNDDLHNYQDIERVHSTNTSAPTAKRPSVLTSRSNRLVDAQALPPEASLPERKANVFVAGSLAVDLSCDYIPRSGSSASSPEPKTSNPAVINQSLGGVGHNVARAAQLMGAPVRLCSVIGNDLSGKAALEALTASDMSKAGIKMLENHSSSRTAQYVAVNDSSKDLVLAMADMAILEQSENTADVFEHFWLPQLRQSRPSHLILDANWSPEVLGRWLQAAKDVKHVSFEPVSNVKSTRLFHLPKPFRLGVYPKSSVHSATPNSFELAAMYNACRESGAFDRADWWQVIDALGIPHTGARTQMALATSGELVDQGIPQQNIQLLPFLPSICTKLGAEGVLLTQIIPAGDERLSSGEYTPYILSRCGNGTEDTLGVGGVYMRLFPAVEEVNRENIISVNGVGDTFAGTLIAGLAKRGERARVEDLVDLAQRAAVLTLKSKESVSPGLGTLRILL